MADKKISALTASSTPLAGTEVLPIVQSSATVKVAVSDLTAGRAVATGALTVTGTMSATTGAAVGGATAGAGGLAFPATAVAVADANTLDDYEEGTWTPTVANFTVSGTSTLSGTYTKIGRVVYFNLSFDNTGTIASGASALITLPFTGIDSSGMIAMSVYTTGDSMTSGKNGVQFVIDAPNSRFFVGAFTTTSAGQTLQFGGFYRVS